LELRFSCGIESSAAQAILLPFPALRGFGDVEGTLGAVSYYAVQRTFRGQLIVDGFSAL